MFRSTSIINRTGGKVKMVVKITSRQVKPLVEVVRKSYPNWKNCQDPHFTADTIKPIEDFLLQSQSLLAKSALESLMRRRQTNQCIARIKRMVQESRKLGIGPGSKADSLLISGGKPAHAEFCRQVISLMYDTKSDAGSRLFHFLEYLEREKIQAEWTLPTLLLFIADSRSEVPIKPIMMRWFCTYIDRRKAFSARPSAQYYQLMKEALFDLRTALSKDGSEKKADEQLRMVETLAFVKFCYEKRKAIKYPVMQRKQTAKAAISYWRIEPVGEKVEWTKYRTEGKLTFSREQDSKEGRWLLGEETQPGDRVIVTRGKNTILGMGTFEGDVIIRDQRKNTLSLPVKWEKTCFLQIADQRWWQGTVQKLEKTQFDRLANFIPDPAEDDETAALDVTILENLRNRTVDAVFAETPKNLSQQVMILWQKVRELLPDNMLERLEFKEESSEWLKKDFRPNHQAGFDMVLALTTKDSPAHETAMLYFRLHDEGLEYGFRIGNYGTIQQQRLQNNCQMYLPALLTIMTGRLGHFDYGLKKIPNSMAAYSPPTDLQRWLENPGAGAFRIMSAMSLAEAVSVSRGQLAKRIAEAFGELYPFVLLALLNDPMPEIARHHGFPAPVGQAGKKEEDEEKAPDREPQTIAECAAATFSTIETIARYLATIKRKKQAIIQGPPGTGKTFLAENLARTLIGDGDGFWELVQFHPAYSYEEFVQGLRPICNPEGHLDYQIVAGRFLEFCRKAQEYKGPCVLVLDEINRANVPRVFGELLYLLEYRDKTIPLAAGEVLNIPSNVLIIGTMNTADHSIALVDFALRRRFAFIELEPDYQILTKYHQVKGTGFDPSKLIQIIEIINEKIAERQFKIGVSYFLKEEIKGDKKDCLEDIWKTEIEPYLDEFFVDRKENLPPYHWGEIKGGI